MLICGIILHEFLLFLLFLFLLLADIITLLWQLYLHFIYVNLSVFNLEVLKY